MLHIYNVTKNTAQKAVSRLGRVLYACMYACVSVPRARTFSVIKAFAKLQAKDTTKQSSILGQGRGHSLY